MKLDKLTPKQLAVFHKLSAPQREILRLWYQEGLNLDDIALEHGITRDEASKELAAAQNALSDLAGEEVR